VPPLSRQTIDATNGRPGRK